MDFFRTIDNAAGENLSWFWKGWFVENYKLDQTIVSVTYDNNISGNGADVTIANLEQMAMPVYISYETKNGKKGTLKLPVEIWNNTNTWKVKLPTTDEVKWVELDAERVFPDMDFGNNLWKAN